MPVPWIVRITGAAFVTPSLYPRVSASCDTAVVVGAKVTTTVHVADGASWSLHVPPVPG
jgi:hypothetical protein